jgi:dihydrolipoamide dehydrogenase
VTDRGFINVDIQMRTNVPHIFAIGDIVGQLGEIALAIEMGADAVDIGKTIHPHPTLGESIGMAAEVAHGSCTDLPPSKR